MKQRINSLACRRANLLSLLKPMFKEGKFLIDNDDELISGSLISKDGVILKSEIIENGGIK